MKNTPLKTAVELVQPDAPLVSLADLTAQQAALEFETAALVQKQTALDVAAKSLHALRHPAAMAIQDLGQFRDRIIDVREYQKRLQPASERFEQSVERYLGITRDPQLNTFPGLRDNDPAGYDAERFIGYASRWLAVNEPRFVAAKDAARELCKAPECSDMASQVEEIVVS